MLLQPVLLWTPSPAAIFFRLPHVGLGGLVSFKQYDFH